MSETTGISESAAPAHSFGDTTRVSPGGTIAEAYDAWSHSYNTDHNATRDLSAQVLQARPELVRGKRVLEVGCGTGLNTIWLAEHASHVTALDFSAGMLAQAHARMGVDADAAPHSRRVTFRQHDLCKPWPVSDGSIDVVVINLVLEHVEQLSPVFAECARVLTAGGTVHVCELHPYRQLRGAQAHFTAIDATEPTRIPAFIHSVSEFVNAGVNAGLALHRLGEWIEEGAAPTALPRVLSLEFIRP